MSTAILAEALARIEHKLDHLLRHNNVPIYPMHFAGNLCSACSKVIEYQIDVQSQVVVRKCDCTTGKVPSAIPLLPVMPTPGASNGYPPPVEEQRSDRAEKGPRRKTS